MIRHELRAPHPSIAGRWIVWDLTAGRYRVESGAGAEISTGIGPRVATGIEGMGGIKHDVYSRETPRGAGRVRTGTRARERSAFLPILFSQRGIDWVSVQRLFWKCLSPDRSITWRVYAPDDSWRELHVFLDEDDTVYPRDPTQIRQVVGVGLVADDPFWLGPTQTLVSSRQGSGQNFFGAAGSAPPFYIEPSGQSGSDFFVADGDELVWPVLTVVGPATGFEARGDGDGWYDRVVSSGMTVPAGQQVVLDFDPRAQAAMLRPATATSGGTNVTSQLARREFFPVDGSWLDGNILALSMVGGGHMSLTYRPRYRRAI